MINTLSIPLSSKRLATLVIAALVITIASVASSLLNDRPAAAISGWNAGNIIEDRVFTDTSRMSAADIQNFLNSKVPDCDTYGTKPSEYGGGTRAQWGATKYGQSTFTCLKDYKENGRTAAQIIYDISQQYTINPQVMLVLLQKEQGLVTDEWPVNTQYRSATGYGCPDSTPGVCNASYYGFTNQVTWAAKMFRAILNNSPTWYTPYVLGNNFIRYSPDASCGGTTVNIQNRSTQALYNYTPYQPNNAALNAGWGTVSCGAYGNRNFYLYFTSWFGPTRFIIEGAINDQYIAYGGFNKLGHPLMNQFCGLKGGVCFQDFERGSIYWNPSSNKAYTVIGGILNKWSSRGKEWSSLGYPTSNEAYYQGYSIQQFEGGALAASDAGIYFILPKMNYTNYRYLGAPKQDTVCGTRDSGCFQRFDKGFIYWSQASGARSVIGGSYDKWETVGKEWGVLGYPTSDEIYGSSIVVQKFQYGQIIHSKNGPKYILSKIDYDATYTFLGHPKTDTICGTKQGGCFQQFDKGFVYQTSATGPNAIYGGIYDKWETVGKEWGVLGYPTSNEYSSGGKTIQNFEHGKISWTASAGARIEN